MRNAVVQMSVSLDGYFEGPDHDIRWHRVDPELHEYTGRALDRADTLFFGRTIYELMAAAWQNEEVIRQFPDVARRMNGLTKIVVSNSLDNVMWQNATLVRGDAVQLLRELKETPGKDIHIGGSKLATSMLNAGLVDELHLLLVPVVLGRGRSIFSGLASPVGLQLVEQRTFGSGVSVQHYRVG